MGEIENDEIELGMIMVWELKEWDRPIEARQKQIALAE